jgi:exosortase
MIPFPGFLIESVSNRLKIISAYLSCHILDLLTISVLREGAMVHFSQGSIEVVDACSGLRSLVSLFSMSCLFAYWSEMSFTKKCILFFSAIPISIAVNIVRILIISLVLHSTGFLIAEGVWHTLLGMFVFLLSIISLYEIRKFLLK